MQTPTIVFDHVNGKVSVTGIDPGAERKLAEVAAGTKDQIATTSGSRRS